MSFSRLSDALAWGACCAVILVLFVGLDSYRRQPLLYGYGPDRRELFAITRVRASQLEQSGGYRIETEERWHRFMGFEKKEGGAARIAARRGIVLLPVAVPRSLEVEIRAKPLAEAAKPAASVEVDYGVNGKTLGRSVIPAEGGILGFQIPATELFIGDNTLFLYRVTPRADPSPWLKLGSIRVRALR